MINLYDTKLREAIDSTIALINRIDKVNMEAEFINLDYHLALIKTAIKLQLNEDKS